MLSDQIATAIAAASTAAALDAVAQIVWRALGSATISEATAEHLQGEIEDRRRAWRAAGPSVGRVSRPSRVVPCRSPDRQRSIERRRRLAASGPMPPGLAASFTVSELATLRIVGDEVRHRGSCRLPLDAIAARAGVSRRTAQTAIRRAAGLGLLTITERRRNRWWNDPNSVEIVDKGWRAWLRIGPQGSRVQKTADHGQSIYKHSAKPSSKAPSGTVRMASRGSEGQSRRQDFELHRSP